MSVSLIHAQDGQTGGGIGGGGGGGREGGRGGGRGGRGLDEGGREPRPAAPGGAAQDGQTLSSTPRMEGSDYHV